MKNKKYIVTVVCVFVYMMFAVHSAYALEITEIMYDIPGSDANREWVEIYNNQSTDIQLEDFKLFENNVGHKISTVEDFSGILHKNKYAVIADDPESFIVDNPKYNGLLYQSSFSLSNAGEELGLVTKSGEIIATTSYAKELGANGSGASLQLFEGVFIEGSPTPGLENVKEVVVSESDVTTSTGSNNSVGISSHESQVELSTVALEKVVYIDIGRERNVREGETVLFQAAAAGQGSARKITYIWNFGDGTTQKGRKVAHTYNHSGTYNVVVNAIMGTSRAVARTQVHVRDVDVTATATNEGLKITNNDVVEINIGSYYIKNKKDKFIFPKDTILNKSSSVLFDWDTINIPFETLNQKTNFLFTSDKNNIVVAIE